MKQELSYRDSVHKMGRVWMFAALILMIAVPTAICIYFAAWPPISGVLAPVPSSVSACTRVWRPAR